MFKRGEVTKKREKHLKILISLIDVNESISLYKEGQIAIFLEQCYFFFLVNNKVSHSKNQWTISKLFCH